MLCVKADSDTSAPPPPAAVRSKDRVRSSGITEQEVLSLSADADRYSRLRAVMRRLALAFPLETPAALGLCTGGGGGGLGKGRMLKG